MWHGPHSPLPPALLCGLAGDAEPGADLGPGVAIGAQALDRLGDGRVDLPCQAEHDGQGLNVAVPDAAAVGAHDAAGEAYSAAGRLTEAITLHERTLADCERVLGDTHPSTLTARHNLAHDYRAARRLAEAIPLFERTLAESERVLGNTHPDTLISRSFLADAYRAVGRLAEAERLRMDSTAQPSDPKNGD